LSNIGKVYTNSGSNISVPDNVDTLILSNPAIDFGKYLVIGRVSLNEKQPANGALFEIHTSNNSIYIEEIPQVYFYGNGTVIGYADIYKSSDFIRLYYYSNKAVTITSVNMTCIRIK
jgi:hypothetical protein